MKRLATLAGLAFAMLIGAFAFSAPAHATTCSTTTSGQFPDNLYWFCGNTSSNKAAGQGALTRLGTNAKNTSHLNQSTHLFFIFNSVSDFTTWCAVTHTGVPNIPCPVGGWPSTPSAGYTYNNGTSTYYSVVIENLADQTQLGTSVANNMAHEAGHQLDYIYGPALGYTFAASETNSGSPVREFNDKLNGFDWPNFNALTNKCGASGGIFTNQYDQFGSIICNAIQNVTIGGTIHSGDTITITVKDSSLSGGQHPVPYTVKPTDTTYNAIALGVANAVNTDVLVNGFVHATVSSAEVDFNSTSTNATFFTAAVSGTETATASARGTNQQVLQAAWPYYFTTESGALGNYWGELYAEENAKVFSSTEGGSHTPDTYVKNYFACTELIVQTLGSTGNLPSVAQYPSNCK